MAETTKLPLKSGKGALAETGLTSFERMRREMDRLFDDFGRGFLSLAPRRFMADVEPFWSSMGRGHEPVVDVVERPDRFEVTAELPGMDEKNIEVKVSNGNLVITGEKKEEREEKEANYHLSERRYGSFQRSFSLPAGVSADRIQANFQKGVLTVTLPKTEEAKKETKIEVKAA